MLAGRCADISRPLTSACRHEWTRCGAMWHWSPLREDCMAYFIRVAASLALMLAAVAGTAPAIGQAVPKQQLLPGGDTETIMKERKNAWTVGLVGGVFEGSFMRFA